MAAIAICTSGAALAQTPVALKTGTTTLGSYATIQAAYNAIPATIAQPYTIEIDETYMGTGEVFPVTFTNKAGASSTNTITVTRPATVNTSVQIIGATSPTIFELNNADWMIFDGIQSPGVMGGSPPGVIAGIFGPAQQVFLLRNGSCNNIIRNMLLISSGEADGITIGSSPSQASGNSDNLIENNYISSMPKCVVIQGDATNVNTRNTITGNRLLYNNIGVDMGVGAGKTYIRNNEMPHQQDADSCIGILHTNLADSLIITGNHMPINNGRPNVPHRGIKISGSNTANYALIANNDIFMNIYKAIEDDTAFYYPDSLNNISAIELAGSAPIKAGIAHNSVLLVGDLDIAMLGTVVSAAFTNSATSSANDILVRNNVFVNNRTGGGPLAQHVVVDLQSNSGTLDMNNNTYSAGTGVQIARVGGTIYTGMAAYQTAAAPAETTSNDQAVLFEDFDDLHLHHTMFGNINLLAPALNWVITDMDGQTRNAVYRGADEYIINCNSTQFVVGSLNYSDDSVCDGYMLGLAAYSTNNGNGVVHKWQSRPAHTSQAFTDIPGADQSLLYYQMSQAMEFRYMDSCLAGGPAMYSGPITIEMQIAADVQTMNDVHIGLNYVFNTTGTFPGAVEWDFGDGSTDNTLNPSHTYAAPGTYTVRLIAQSECGPDTLEYAVSPSLSVSNIENRENLRVYPNPAHDNITIDCQQIPAGDVQVSVISVTGARVYTTKLEHGGNNFKTTLQTSSLPAGIYVVELKAGSEMRRTNLVIQ